MAVTHSLTDHMTMVYSYIIQDNYKRAIRPVLREDRILAIEQKFFCDRTTEKTVTLFARDNQNSQKTVSNSTVRLRCFYKTSSSDLISP